MRLRCPAVQSKLGEEYRISPRSVCLFRYATRTRSCRWLFVGCMPEDRDTTSGEFRSFGLTGIVPCAHDDPQRSFPLPGSSVRFRRACVKQVAPESGRRRCGRLCCSIQTLQCLDPCSWRRAQNSSEHFHKWGRLAISQCKADFLDRMPRDKQFDSLHQAHLPPPKLEVRTDFSTKDSLNCPDASTGRSAHCC